MIYMCMCIHLCIYTHWRRRWQPTLVLPPGKSHGRGAGGLQSMRSRVSGFTSLTSYFISGEGNGNPLLYSRLENPMDRGAWQATVHALQRVGHDCSDWARIYSHIRTRVCWVASVMFDSATPGTVAHQASLSRRISRREHWSALPRPPPKDLPDPGIEPASPLAPALQVGSSLLSQVEGRAHRLRSWITPLSWRRACVTQWRYEPCHAVPQWRVLTKCGPLERQMATPSSILAWRTPWAVGKAER